MTDSNRQRLCWFTHVPASLSKQQRTCIVLAVYPVAAVWEGRVLCSSVSGRWGEGEREGEGKGRGHYSHIARCMFEYVLDLLTAAWTWKITNGNDSPVKEQQHPHQHEPLQPIAACVCTADAPQSGVHRLESTSMNHEGRVMREYEDFRGSIWKEFLRQINSNPCHTGQGVMDIIYNFGDFLFIFFYFLDWLKFGLSKGGQMWHNNCGERKK